jgi:hypothetical protein
VAPDRPLSKEVARRVREEGEGRGIERRDESEGVVCYARIAKRFEVKLLLIQCYIQIDK